MTTSPRTIRRFIAALVFLLGPAIPSIRSDEGPAVPVLSDPDLFPAELFPGLEQLNESDLLLEGLHQHYPNRLLDHPPPELIPTEGDPLLREKDGGVDYVRVRGLSTALPSIQAALDEPVALIDLRYVHADLETAIALGALLARNDRLVLDLIGDYATVAGMEATDRLTVQTEPADSSTSLVIVLVNEETGGPLEAVLAELQSRHRILSIGRTTAGLTATYRPLPGFPGWHAISGEIRPASLGSLVGIGLQPSIPVDAEAATEKEAYDRFDPEKPLQTVLEQSIEKERYDEARLLREFPHPDTAAVPRPTARTTPTENETDNPPPPPVDQSLRRAFYVIEGMRAFGRIPED
ncbi:MAG: hypothetical protein R3F07_17470 [Opitutaceae bacterium]